MSNHTNNCPGWQSNPRHATQHKVPRRPPWSYTTGAVKFRLHWFALRYGRQAVYRRLRHAHPFTITKYIFCTNILTNARFQSFQWMSRVLQAVDSIHQVGIYCLALVQPNYLPKTPLGGIHLSECKRRFLEGTLHPANVLMCPHTCVTNLPKPREIHSGKNFHIILNTARAVAIVIFSAGCLPN